MWVSKLTVRQNGEEAVEAFKNNAFDLDLNGYSDAGDGWP